MTDSLSIQLPDQSARKNALDIRQSFIVQAPAGSGKTELLTLRYLKLLATASQPEEVLAITFTKKAASEMRDRIASILSWCQNFLDGDTTQISDIEAFKLGIGKSVLERDRREEWHLLESPSRLRVQTIDSLSFYLAKQLPTLSQIGGSPTVTEDIEVCCREAINATLAQLESGTELAYHIEVVLTHLDNDLVSIGNQLLGMLGQRDQWSNYVIDLTINKTGTSQFLKLGLIELIEETLLSVTKLLNESEDELIELANFAAANLNNEKDKLSIASFFPLESLPESNIEALPVWLFLLSFLLKKQRADDLGPPDWLRQANKNHGFPASSNGDKEGQSICKEYKTKRTDLISKLKEKPGALQELAFIRLLPTSEEDSDQWDFLNSLCNVLRALNAELLLAFTRHRVVDHIQISAAARMALGTEDEPTDLALALDNNINHILVDEFQDTSQLQLSLLKKLTAGWQTDDWRTLFLVGDAMQSCYSFRNANVGIFLDVQKRGLEHIKLETLVLQSNFRSQQPLIDWVNGTFADAFPAKADVSRGAVPYNRAEVIHKKSDGKGVEVDLIEYESDQRQQALFQESEQLADKVLKLQEQFPGDSIAILVRTRTQLKTVIPSLRARALSWRANDIDRLTELPVIEDLLSLVKVILSPGDHFSWLCLLRAPWCGLTSADLLELNHHSRESNIWSSTKEYRSITGLSLHAKQVLPQFIIAMQFAIASRYKRSLRQSVEATWGLLRGINCCRDDNEINCVQRFFTLLSEEEKAGGLGDIFAFEEKVSSTFIPSPETMSQACGLQLLTMHKSKGLEFDHVLLPGLSQTARHDDKDLLVWHERLNAAGNPRLFLAAVTPAGSDESNLYTFIRHEQKVRQKLESTRLLYIAITRAKKSATLFASIIKEKDGGFRKPPEGSLLSLIWPQLCSQGALCSQSSNSSTHIFQERMEKRHSTTGPTMITRLRPILEFTESEQQAIQDLIAKFENNHQTADDRVFEWSNDLNARTKADRVASKTGTLIHKVFETYINSNDKSNYLAQLKTIKSYWRLGLRSLQLSSDEMDRTLSQMEETVYRTLSSPTLAWIFDNQSSESACELKITQRQKGHLKQFIIDRTFIDQSNTRWIIDFKTSVRPIGESESDFISAQTEKHRSQLEIYRDLMMASENRPIRLALLLTEIPALVEIKPN